MTAPADTPLAVAQDLAVRALHDQDRDVLVQICELAVTQGWTGPQLLGPRMDQLLDHHSILLLSMMCFAGEREAWGWRLCAWLKAREMLQQGWWPEADDRWIGRGGHMYSADFIAWTEGRSHGPAPDEELYYALDYRLLSVSEEETRLWLEAVVGMLLMGDDRDMQEAE